jgi:hypothetical protein
MFAFALVYGTISEALVFQTLWNPNWEGLRVLDYGFVPGLGTSPPWIMLMVGVHTVWSMSVPIALAESLAGPRRDTPWLGTRGLIVTAVVFVLGVALVVSGSLAKAGNFLTAPRLVVSLAVIGALVVLGLRLSRNLPRPQTAGRAPGPWAVGAFALAAGSFFLLWYDATDLSGRLPFRLGLPIPVWLSVAGYLALFTVVLTLVARWSRRSGWSQAHRLALAGGAVLVYAWHSFLWPPVGIPTIPAIDLAGDAFFTAVALLLLMTAARRLSREAVPDHAR